MDAKVVSKLCELPSSPAFASVRFAFGLPAEHCRVSSFLHPSSAPEGILKRADDLRWPNSWIAAEPLNPPRRNGISPQARPVQRPLCAGEPDSGAPQIFDPNPQPNCRTTKGP